MSHRTGNTDALRAAAEGEYDKFFDLLDEAENCGGPDCRPPPVVRQTPREEESEE